MITNKIYKIPLLVLTVGIPIKLVATDNPSHTREKALSLPGVASLLEKNLGTVENFRFNKIMDSVGRIKCEVTVKSLELDSKTLTVMLDWKDTSLPTIIKKIRQQLDSDPNGICTKFGGDRPSQQFRESDMSLVIYYQDPVSKEFKRYINTPDTQNPEIATPIQLDTAQLATIQCYNYQDPVSKEFKRYINTPDTQNPEIQLDTAQLATIQCYMTFNRLPLKKILKISVVKNLLRPKNLPTDQGELKKVLEGTCINNRWDEVFGSAWVYDFLSLNPTSTDDPLSYTLRRPLWWFVEIVRIPRALIRNTNEEANRVNREAVTKNSAEIIKILSPDTLPKQLLFDKRNSLLILKTKYDRGYLPSKWQFYLLLNVGNDNQYTRVGNDDEYSSYAVIKIDSETMLFSNPYIEKLAESPATSSDIL